MRNSGNLVGRLLVLVLVAIGGIRTEAADAPITITPVAPDNALVFSPKTEVAVAFKLANKTGEALAATLAATTFAGQAVTNSVERKVEANGEPTVTFPLGKLAAGFYNLNLTVSRGDKLQHKASFPLAVGERPQSPKLSPVLPIGVYVNGTKNLKGQDAVYLNTYVHAMAQDIAAHHFNTVVVDELYGPEQIAIFGQYGLAALVREKVEERLALPSVIGGIMADNPAPDDILPLMKRQKDLSAKVPKPLMIGVRGDFAGTKSPQNPIRIWKPIWDELKESPTKISTKSVTNMIPVVRLYWSYYPIEHGSPYPILQSHVYKGCFSFLDSLGQALSGLGCLGELQNNENGTRKGDPIVEFFGWIPLWVKLQAFGTTRAVSNYKVPTPAELQVMMHLAKAYGAKGIMLDCYQTDQPGYSGMVDPVSLQPVDGRLAAAGQVAQQILAHADLFAKAYGGGGGLRYNNPFVAPLSFNTGSKATGDRVSYLYVVNLDTQAPVSFWLFDMPRMLRDIDNGQELSCEMYETDDSSWWGLAMTLQPGQARIFEKVDTLPTTHQ